MKCNHCGQEVSGGTYIQGVFYCPWCAAEIIKAYQPPNPIYELTPDFKLIPAPCRGCPNHPSNGGSGICHCILGSPSIT
jgi:hypothetical protein